MQYYVFYPPGHPCSPSPSHSPEVRRVTLGTAYDHSQTPIVSVPGGCWKALQLCDGVEYALMANVLSPEFTDDRVNIGAGPGFVELFAGRATWATATFLRELIGQQNWVDEQSTSGE